MKEFTFEFKPNKLKKTLEKIKKTLPSEKGLEQKHKEASEDINLENLIEKIKKIDSNKINYFANSLKIKEIYTLAFNFNDIPDQVKNKVSNIIIERNKKTIVKIMWDNFCKDYNNNFTIYYFSEILKRINFSFDERPYNMLDVIFEDKNPLINITKILFDNGYTYEEGISSFNLLQNTKISFKLAELFFSEATSDIIKNEKLGVLINLCRSLKIKGLKKFANNYLKKLTRDEFSEDLMYVYKNRLGDPREEYSTSWEDIDKSGRKKAIKWFNRQEMLDFFNNIEGGQEEAYRRFNYWMKYEDNIENVYYIKERLQLFLIFNNFVVIEFGRIGNAAYIYEIDYFNKYFSKYTKEEYAVSNSKLKHTSKARDNYNNQVYKINHHSRWEFNADILINSLL